MMICTANGGWYATNGTGTHEPSQPFGGMANIMATAEAYLKPVAAMILGKSNFCREASRGMVPLV
jgi:hypothetical protein